MSISVSTMKLTLSSMWSFLVILLVINVSDGQIRRNPNSRTSFRPLSSRNSIAERPVRYRRIPWRMHQSLSSTTPNNQKISSNIYFRDGKIYYFNNTAVTFGEAKNFCDLLGMTMVHVRSEEENKFISTFRNCTFSGIWFGVKRSDDDPSRFVWMDSSNITVEVPKEDSYYDQCNGMSRNISNCCSMRQCRYSDCTPCHKWFASPCDQPHMIACEAVIDINLIRKVLVDDDTPFSSPLESDQIDLGALKSELDNLRKRMDEEKSPHSSFLTSFLVLLIMLSLIAITVYGYQKFKYVPMVVRGRENLSTLVRSTGNRIESLNKSIYTSTRRGDGRTDCGNEYASMVEETICETR